MKESYSLAFTSVRDVVSGIQSGQDLVGVAKQFDNLSKAQQSFVMAQQGISSAQKEGMLAFSNGSKFENSFSKDELTGILKKRGWDESQASATLDAMGFVSSTEEISMAQLKAKASTNEMSQALYEQVHAQQAANAANVDATAGLNSVQKGMLAYQKSIEQARIKNRADAMLDNVQRTPNSPLHLDSAELLGAKLDTSKINAYKEALSGLDAAQQAVLLKQHGMSGAQIFDITGIDKYINKVDVAKKALQGINLQSELSAFEVFDEKMNAEHLEKVRTTLDGVAESVGGLSDADKISALSKQGYNQAQMQQIIGEEAYNAVMTKNIAAQAANTAATNADTAANTANATSIGQKVSAVGAGIKGWWSGLGGFAKFGLIAGAVAIGIGLATAAFDKLTTSAEETIERVDSVKNEYESLKNTVDSNKKSIDGFKDEYIKLSDGVDSLGRNVSLTTEEYARYNEITGQIATMFPTLVSGYDSQGNAILNLKGNLSELTDAYKESEKAAYNKLIAGSEDGTAQDIVDNYKNLSKITTADAFSLDNFFNGSQLKTDVEYDTALRALETLSKKTYPEVVDQLKTWDVEGKRVLTKYINDSIGLSSRTTEEEFEASKQTLLAEMASIKAIFTERLADVKSVANAYLNVSDIFSGLDDDSKNYASKLVNSIDENIANSFNSKTDVGSYVNGVLAKIQTDPALNSAMSELFSDEIMDLDITSMSSKVDELIGQIAESLGEDAGDLKNRFNFGFVDDLMDEYRNALSYAYENFSEVSSPEDAGLVAFFKKNSVNTQEEMVLWKEVVSDAAEEGLSLQDAMRNYLDKKDIIEVPSVISEMSESFALAKESQTALSTAMQESNQYTGLTADSIAALTDRYKDLEGFDPEALFENTSHGVQLNSQALELLEQQYASKNGVDYYSAVKQSFEAWQNAIASGQEQSTIDSLEQTYLQAQQLAAQYDGLTSAYGRWQTAQQTEDPGNKYDALYSNLEKTKELYEQNRTGTDDFKTSVQMMTNKDLTGSDNAKYVEVYEKNKGKFERYFKDNDKNGIGAENFLKDLSAINQEWAKFNEDTDGWSLDFGNHNKNEIADSIGINVEAVQTIIDKLEEYGINVDKPADSLKKMREEAEAADQKLKELSKEHVSPKFGTEDLDTIQSQIETASDELDKFRNKDGTVNIKQEGANEAVAILQTLIREKQELEKPTILKTDTSSMPAEIQEGIRILNDYQTAKDQLESDKIVFGADSSQIQESQKDLDNAKIALENLPKEFATEFGVTGETPDQIIQKFEANELVIPVKFGQPETTEYQDSYLMSQTQGVTVENENKTTVTVEVVGQEKIASLNEDIQGIPSQKTVSVTVNATGSGAVDSLADSCESVKSKEVSVTAEVTGKSNVDDLIGAIDDLTGKTVSVGASVFGKTSLQELRDEISKVKGKTVTVKTIKKEEKAEVNGTANANGSSIQNFYGGSSYARGTSGNFGLPNNQNNTLVNELGNEMLVRDGSWHIIPGGTQFIDLKKGDIIFNHKQTEDLFRNGIIAGRGKMVGGSARVDGTTSGKAYSGGFAGGNASEGKVTSGGSNSGNSNADNNSDNKDYIKKNTDATNDNTSSNEKLKNSLEKFKNLFDWIEIKLDRLADATEKATDKIDLVYSKSKGYYTQHSSYTAQNDQVNSAISANKAEQRANEDGYKKYNKKAKELALKKPKSLSNSVFEKVRDGSINLSDYSETNRDFIEEYQRWYEKAKDCLDTVQELKKEQRELEMMKLDNIQEHYESRLEYYSSLADLNQANIDLSRAKDPNFVGSNFDSNLKSLKTNKVKELSQLEKQAKDLQKQFNSLVKRGIIKEGSQEWFEWQSNINGVKTEAAGVKKELSEIAKLKFDNLKEYFDLRSNYRDTIDSQYAAYKDYNEAIGKVVSKNTYSKMISNLEGGGKNSDGTKNTGKLGHLENEKASLIKERDRLVKSGDLKVNSEEWYNMQTAIRDVQTEIYNTKKTVEEYKQEMYQLSLVPIDNNIKELQASNDAIKEKIDLYETMGKTVTANMYELLIAKGELEKEAEKSKLALIQAEMDRILKNGGSKESEIYQSLLDDYNQCQSSISEITKNQEKWNQAIFDLDVKQIDNVLTRLEKARGVLESLMGLREAQGHDAEADDYLSLIKNADSEISEYEKQIARTKAEMDRILANGGDTNSDRYVELEEELMDLQGTILDTKKSQEEWNDAILDIRIDQIKEEREEFEKQNDALDKKIRLEKALDALAKARTQRSKMVYRDGIGFVYEADQQAIKDAQEELDAVYRQDVLDKFDEAIEAIESLKDNNNLYDKNGNSNNPTEKVDPPTPETPDRNVEITQDDLNDLLDKLGNKNKNPYLRTSISDLDISSLSSVSALGDGDFSRLMAIPPDISSFEAPFKEFTDAFKANVTNPEGIVNNSSQSVVVTIGDINLHEVNNARDLKNEIMTRLPNVAKQVRYKT